MQHAVYGKHCTMLGWHWQSQMYTSFIINEVVLRFGHQIFQYLNLCYLFQKCFPDFRESCCRFWRKTVLGAPYSRTCVEPCHITPVSHLVRLDRVRSERIHYGCVRGCDSHVQTHWLLLCILNTELSTSWLTEFVKVFLTRSFESRRHHYVSSVNTAAQMSCQDFSWIFEHKVIYLWSQWSMHPCIKYHCSAFYNMKEESICSVGFLHIMFLNTI